MNVTGSEGSGIFMLCNGAHAERDGHCVRCGSAMPARGVVLRASARRLTDGALVGHVRALQDERDRLRAALVALDARHQAMLAELEARVAAHFP